MTDTIEKTANKLLGMHDDLVRVLGTAYMQEHIEKDKNKGLE
jgi:hypothetical protein